MYCVWSSKHPAHILAPQVASNDGSKLSISVQRCAMLRWFDTECVGLNQLLHQSESPGSPKHDSRADA